MVAYAKGTCEGERDDDEYYSKRRKQQEKNRVKFVRRNDFAYDERKPAGLFRQWRWRRHFHFVLIIESIPSQSLFVLPVSFAST